jgi:Do/DeqQ family serine protease
MSLKKIILISTLGILSFTSSANTLILKNEYQKPTISPMLKEVLPSVVSVSVEGKKKYKQEIPEFIKPFLKDNVPFPEENIIEKPFKGIGSGVVINGKEGYIVTNNHVIKNAQEIFITLNNGEKYKAKKIGTDSKSDIAVLQIEVNDLKTIKIGNSDELEVGEFVVAIGNPLGLSQSVTTGIISALSRSGLGLALDGLENFIQTDAAINRGNSGGALINWKGELIGINTAIAGVNGGNIGIGFAIPSNMVKNLVEQIIEHGEVKRGLLGIMGGNITPDLFKALDLEISKGAFITEVLVDSAADKGGIEIGDIITHIDNKKIVSFNELKARIGSLRAGAEVKINLLRKNESKEIIIILGRETTEDIIEENINSAFQGIALSIKGESILVNEILKNSYAYMIGLRDGDIINKVNNKEVNDFQNLKQEVDNASKLIVLEILRQDNKVLLMMNKK